MLRDGERVVNQHGHTGTVIRSVWNCGAPYQVRDQFGRYHSDILEDGSSTKNNVYWRPVEAIKLAV